MKNSEEKIAVCILCDEAASLFEGGESHPRFGGAGVHMYFLAKGLAENPNYEVYVIFDNVTAKGLSEKKTKFISLYDNPSKSKRPIRRGVPIISRLINSWRASRKKSLYAELPEKRVFISTMALWANRLREEAKAAGAHTIFQTASETDVTQPRGCAQEKSGSLLDGIAACDKILVQTDAQQKNLFKNRKRDSQVVRKGFPAPPAIPDVERSGVVWVGSAQALKQPWVACYLAQMCPQISFTIVMPPAESGVAFTVAGLAADLPNVTLVDYQVGYDEAQQYFDTAKVFLYSGMLGTDPPITMLQAALGGCAILSTCLDPDNEMLEKGGCGMLRTSFEEAAQEIRRLCNDEDYRSTFADRAFEYVTQHYSYDAMVETYSQVINGFFETPQHVDVTKEECE